jgi:mevalonate kinase
MKHFKTSVSGKWILAGEHSVLRGVPALVFPLHTRTLDLEFIQKESDEKLTLNLTGPFGQDLELLFWGVLERACKIKKLDRSLIKGSLTLSNAIRIGAGMGASATLCVAVARWFDFMGFVQSQDSEQAKQEALYEFAKELENLFHGESSGVDIAVSLRGAPLHFERKNGFSKELKMNWQPLWFVSYSGKRGVTLDCVNKVKALIAKDPVLGAQLDEQMNQAVEQCEKALMNQNAQEGFELLAKSIRSAGEVFDKWGLALGEVGEHIRWLYAQGAAAVKPTGSGDGGFILSLWVEPPPKNILDQLSPCYK